MKKIFLALAAVLALGGCGNDDYYGSDYASGNTTTLYLVDEENYAYAGIPYLCDSMNNWRKTRKDGAFVFVEPDTCKFDFYGLDGLYSDEFDEVVRIVDYTNDGKAEIPYECSSFGVSSTYSDGSFDYDEDDVCTFYL
jgi:hypothetical protein